MMPVRPAAITMVRLPENTSRRNLYSDTTSSSVVKTNPMVSFFIMPCIAVLAGSLSFSNPHCVKK